MIKIPDIFIPEKDLGEKVDDLAKEQHLKPETDEINYEPRVYLITDPTYLEIIQKKAEQIATKLGRKK